LLLILEFSYTKSHLRFLKVDKAKRRQYSELMEITPAVLARNFGRLLPSNFLHLLFSDQDPQVFSYADCYGRAAYFNRVFRKRTVPGKRVAILLEHSLDLYASFLGALLGGFVPAIFPPPSPKIAASDYISILENLIHDTAPAVVLVEARNAFLMTGLRGTQIVVPESGVFDGTAIEIAHPIKPTDTAFLQYSSGTTGRRKGVAISHQALLWQVNTYAEVLGINSQDKFISWLPLYHDMGLIACFLLPFLRGNPLVALSPFDWVKKPLKLLEAIDSYRPQWCWLPNFAFCFLARSKRPGSNWDLGSIRGWINCSEPITPDSIERFCAAFATNGVRQETVLGCYAMAETVFAIAQQRPNAGGPNVVSVRGNSFAPGAVLECAVEGQSESRKFVSSGTLLSETEVRIVDETGEARCEDRVLGEIIVRSPSLFSGYDNVTNLSTPSLRTGFLPTGDLGFMLNGHLFVVGRKKELIIVQGKNILPHDVENAVNDVEGVIPGRCVAFGAFDANEGTERLVVVAETHQNNSEARLTLLEHIRHAVLVAADVAAADVCLVEHMWLVKSTSGKISRSKNRERYLEMLSARRSTAPSRTGQTQLIVGKTEIQLAVDRLVRAQLPALIDADLKKVRLISDGWIDSLGVAEMITRIEMDLGLTFDLREVANLQVFDSVTSIAALVELHYLRSSAVKEARIELRQMDEIRSVKTRIYRESSRDFDLLVLGSSRCFMLHSSVAKRFGFKSFNFSVDSGRTEDFYCMLRLVLEQNRIKPRWVFVGLDLETFSDQARVEPSLYACPDLAKYIDVSPTPTAAISLDTRQDELWQVFRRGINETVDYGFAKNTGDIVWRFFQPDAPPVKIADGNDRNAVYFRRMEEFTKLSFARLRWLDEIGRLCHEHGISWLLFLSTAHEALLKFLVERTTYQQRLNELTERIHQSPFAPNAFFDLSNVSSFEGDPHDFQNGAHIASYNGRRVFSFLLKQAAQIDRGRPES
jgi:acyl-CoA synthetase (AMP-forming)/AMP-acid ligase II/acyl carrier protein